jgi:hypothetical protein
MTAARTPSKTPDLFWHGSDREPSSRSENPPSSSLAVAKAVNHLSSPRHVLPGDLHSAVKQLNDQEFDRLVSAVVAEQKRRGRKSALLNEGKRQVETSSTSLTRGQINAVLSAFKAGITPSRIARQFGLSQSDVRKALASGDSK